jgi:Region found in RelA / SpoT proteins
MILPSLNVNKSRQSAVQADGYRCHHMVYKFRGSRDEEFYNGRRVEVQVRTQLQHSWATAVEAVGLFRREDLKAGRGDPDWLRLFKLVSAEFPVEEGCERADIQRAEEIMRLERKLDAVDTLERLSQAFSYSENYVFDPNNKPDYFQIEYDRAAERVHIRPYHGPIFATQSYDAAEVKNAEFGSRDTKIVLVEVDEVENLRAAYPNYFGDVQKFKSKLRVIAKHDEAMDYSVPAQQRVPPKPRVKPDYSWLHSFPMLRPAALVGTVAALRYGLGFGHTELLSIPSSRPWLARCFAPTSLTSSI